jgi:NADH:ubiquinone oxidoreductase subunit 3 (subunit A)
LGCYEVVFSLTSSGEETAIDEMGKCSLAISSRCKRRYYNVSIIYITFEIELWILFGQPPTCGYKVYTTQTKGDVTFLVYIIP